MTGGGSRLERMRSLTINLAASFDDPGGWGRYARCFGAALDRHARVVPLHHRPATGRRHAGEDAAPLRPARWDDGGVGVCFGPPDQLISLPGRALVFATVCETTRLPAARLRHLQRADQLWLPTAWSQGLLVRAGLSAARLRVAPGGVDAGRFRPAPRRQALRAFRFLCVGKWEARKGTADLVRTFCRTFRPEEPVELVMHSDNPYAPGLCVRSAVQREMQRAGHPAARIVVSDPVPVERLISLMQGCDAFVLPTRGESWGLPILEAMACGLPCIVTDYGGHRAFADPANSFLIAVERMCPVEDPAAFARGEDWGEWAQPDLDHLAHLLRFVYEHREATRAKGERARAAARRWSWDRAARIALRHLDDLLRPRELGSDDGRAPERADPDPGQGCAASP